MKRFEVTLNGVNFILNVDGEHKLFGFHATRYVLAETAVEAEKIAAIMIHKNPMIKDAVTGEKSVSPKIKVVGTREVGALRFFFKKSEAALDFYALDSVESLPEESQSV